MYSVCTSLSVRVCVYVCSMSESVQLPESACTAHAPTCSNGAGVGVQFGSNVSRLKSRFLQHVSDVVDPVAPVCAGHGRRPESSGSRPVRQASLPSTSDNCLVDMSDHVEKFRHTRALFAQLAEQSSRPSPPPIPRSFRSTSSASPPPTRSGGRVDQQARRSVSPSNSRSSSSSQTFEGQTRSCNGAVTTWSQLESRSYQQNPTSVALTSHTFSQSLDEPSRSGASGLDLSSRSSAETLRPLVGSRALNEGSGSQVNSRASGSASDASSRSLAESSRSSADGTRPQVGSKASVSDVTSRSLADGSRSWLGGGAEGSEVVLRRANRPGLDLSSGRGVLLPRRRSREDGTKCLLVSKDLLEASLCEADEYWRRQQVEDLSTAAGLADCGVADALMSESTFSSGSGEEMARSESGHDLAAALKDTTVSPTADSAEMWSRRLSAALDAKNSELDSSSGGTTDSSVVPRSLWGRDDLENTTGGRASDCEKTPVCSAADYSQHAALHNGSGTVVPSRSLDGSRSLPNSAVGSSAVLEIVTGSVTDYNLHVTPLNDSSHNMSTPVNLSRSFDSARSCPPQCDLAGGSLAVSETVQCSATDLLETDIDKTLLSTVNDISRSLSGRCDLERGSETDYETLEGSVADCECKDADTEKWLLVEESANSCCESVTCSSTSTTTTTTTTTTNTTTAVVAANDDIDTQPHETAGKSTCSSDIQFTTSQLHDDGDTCLAKSETDTVKPCGLNLSRSEQLQDVVDTTCVSSNEQSCVCGNLSTKTTCLSAGLYLEKTDNSDTILLDQRHISSTAQRHSADDGTVPKCGVDDTNDTLAMSISEDDESSGDTDYVVLGQPVSKQQTAATRQAVKQSNVT